MAPLDKLVAILKTVTTNELWETVLEAVSKAEWKRSRLLEDAPISMRSSPSRNMPLLSGIRNWRWRPL